MKSKAIILLTTYYLILTTVMGCEAFVRKFTRKPKKGKAKEEMVLVPQEYKGPEMTKEELYRQYFLYWRAWQDELITSLSQGANHKKQIDCTREAIKNLKQLRTLLNAQKQKKLDNHIIQLEELKGSITKDSYGNRIAQNRLSAERIKRNILRDFSYHKIKEYLA